MSDEHDEHDEQGVLDPELLDRIETELLGGTRVFTRREVAEQAGVDLDLAEQLWHSLGFPHASDDEATFTESDVKALQQSLRLVELGVLDEDSQTAMVRTWGRSFARLAEWQSTLLTRQALESVDPERQLVELAMEVIPLVDSLQSYIWRRHLLSAAGRMLLRPDGSERAEAVGFVDIVGYTTQSKNLSQSELIDLVETFEDFAASTITDHAGQLIKTIGDEVLFTTGSAREAAQVALLLVERADEDERFPQVRAGVAYGEVLSQLGDVFGPTVNIASRLTSLARPGKILVDRACADELRADEEEDPEFRLRRLRRTSVKGYSRIEAFRLDRPKSKHGDDDEGDRPDVEDSEE